MTGEQFVKLCYEEKEAILKEYFSADSKTAVSKKIEKLIKSGVSKDDLFDVIHAILNENYYTLLLALDGEASLGKLQVAYKLYDEDNNLLNECGEIEEAAYKYFMEE